MNMDFKEIFEELKQKGIIDQSFKEISPLSESGNSKVFGISSGGVYKYVVKVNRPMHIKAETTFIKEYQKNPLTPQLLYVDPEFKFLVYHYISGKKFEGEMGKSVWIEDLIKNYINNYTTNSQAKWGYLDDPCPTYADVLISDINYWKIAMQKLTEDDHKLVLKFAAEIGDQFEREKYLVHGDPSIRNLLFDETKLVAVIDPYPLVAPKIYDVLYAFCSNTQDFDQDCLRSAVSVLTGWEKNEEILIKHLLINLYCRIGICLKHQTGDMDGHLKAWNYWKMLLHKM
jgi:thiamine kinase-like enzyme